MPDANVFSLPFPSTGAHYRGSHIASTSFSVVAKQGAHYGKLHSGKVAAFGNQSATTTYYYRTTSGDHGYTTSVSSIPSGAVVEARIAS